MKTSDVLSKIQKVNIDALSAALAHLKLFGVSENTLDNMKPLARKELEKMLGAPQPKKAK